MKLSKTLASLAAVVAMSAQPLASQAAAFKLKISDGISDSLGTNLFNDVIVGDNSAGDLAGLAGNIVYFGAYGDYEVTIASGTSVYDPLEMTLGIQVQQLSATAPAHKLVFELTQTGLSAGAGGPVMFFGGGGVATLGGSSFEMFADSTNAEFGTGSALFSAAGDGLYSKTGSASTTGLYSATIRATADFTAFTGIKAGAIDLNLNVNVVPEPGTIALAGLALLGMGLARRRQA